MSQSKVASVDSPAVAVARRMGDAVARWLGSLSEKQYERALYPAPLETPEAERDRLTWFYTPTDHGGVTLGELTPRQQGLAMEVVSSGLSMEGYATVCAIIGVENILDRVEAFTSTWGRERGRDPGAYYLRVFGDPRAGDKWAWRFGGHHISLNNLIVRGELRSTTPSFFGSDPAESPMVGGGSLRPLGGCEDIARELLNSLDDTQRGTAVLLDRAISDIVSGNRAWISDGDEMIHMQDLWNGQYQDPRFTERIDLIDRDAEAASGYDENDHRLMALTRNPKGLAARNMTQAQRAMLRALLASYYRRAPSELTTAEEDFYAEDINLDSVHFAWAGGGDRRDGHYYRVQGPRVLIEYDNTQRRGNHVHAVWRNPVTDFGLDVLYSHLDTFHRSK